MKYVSFKLKLFHPEGKQTIYSNKNYINIRKILKHDYEKYSHVLKENIWHYTWSDGWNATVESKVLTGYKEKKILLKNTDGFCGYNEMINDILSFNEIKLGRK